MPLRKWARPYCWDLTDTVLIQSDTKMAITTIATMLTATTTMTVLITRGATTTTVTTAPRPGTDQANGTRENGHIICSRR
jgi:hypothetical protein